jgi:hypothetical protein
VGYGPGLDMPVLDIDPAGRGETFDGWFRRGDDAPLVDEITGRIEPWSRDWLHPVLVVGVTPASILVDDPLGAQRWFRRSTFQAAYATFDQMAVVIG